MRRPAAARLWNLIRRPFARNTAQLRTRGGALRGRFARLESLETRSLLSVAPTKAGTEFLVNTATVGEQRLAEATPSAIGIDAEGDYVITWASQSQDGDGWGVYAQRFRADGVKVGGEFRVNTSVLRNQQNPTAAMDPDGDFLITWSQLNDNDTDGVYVRRYNAAGEAQGEEFLVSDVNPSWQRLSVAAMDAQGNFVVAWSERDPSQPDPQTESNVMARLFTAEGLPLTAGFRVNTTTTDVQRQAAVARNEQGAFVIVWASRGQDGDAEGVYGQRYAADGTPLGGEFQVHQATAGQQLRPTVAIDATGDFAVTWHNSDASGSVARDVYARRFGADGTPLGDEFVVNTTTVDSQRHGAIAMDSDGDMVVVWSSSGQDNADGEFGVYGQQFSSTGAKIGSEFRVNTVTAGRQILPAIAMDDDGDFVVAWNSLAQDGDTYGVYGQRFTQPDVDNAPPRVANVFVEGNDHAVLEGSRLVAGMTRMIVPFTENMNASSTGGANSVTNRNNWQLTRNGVDVSTQISSVSFALNSTLNRREATVNFASALTEGYYVLSAKPTIRDVNANSLDGNYDGVGGDAFSRTFTVSLPIATGPEFRVNTLTAGDQLFSPAAPGVVATDAAGNALIVWTSANQDGDGLGVFAQRYAVDGSPLGGEFRVNSVVAGDQRLPSAAMRLDGSSTVITWTSVGQDGDSDGIYGQLYDAQGVPVGGEFLVNTETARAQSRSSVAMDEDGNFVVAWESNGQDGSGTGIYFQRFLADGTKMGVETRVNTFTTDIQRLPQVAMDADGDFVVTWTSNLQDGAGYGVYARRYAASGAPFSNEFRVNSVTTGDQEFSSVAMDGDGDFVIVFQSSTADGNGDGILMQRYTAAGLAVGNNVVVNATTTNEQRNPAVSMDRDGDYVVAWQSQGQDGSSWGAYAQRYGWNGVRQGTEFRVNSTTPNTQVNANLAVDADGDFLIAWMSLTQDGSGQGIYAQRYRAFENTPPTAVAGGPYAIVEGASLSLDGSASSDPDVGQPLSYAWDIDNDGAFDDAVGATPTLTWTELSAIGIADDGEYPIRLRVTDATGGSAIDSTTLTVLNGAPGGVIVNVTPVTTINEGATALLNGSFFDPGTADVHAVTIDWGDGQQQTVQLNAGSRVFSLTHVYTDDNPSGTASDVLTISAFVTDDDGGQSLPGNRNITVQNVAPTMTSFTASPLSVPEGGEVTINGAFTDAGAGDTHQLLVNWGDGAITIETVNQQSRTFTARHTYGPNAPVQPLIQAFLSDDDGGARTATAAVTIVNAPPEVTELSLSANTVAEGETVTLNGVFVDTSPNDTHTVVVAWGDGAASIATLDPVTKSFTASHAYADDQPTGTASDVYAINVTISDNRDAVGTDSIELTVANAPPQSLQILPVQAVQEGGAVLLSGSFTELGGLDTHTLIVEWGDGAQTSIDLPAGARTFEALHQFQDDAPTGTATDAMPIVVRVRDDDTGEVQATVTAQVTNVAPSVANLLVAPGLVNEGAPVSLTGTIVDVGLLDTHSVTIAWGDGASTPAVVDPVTRTFAAVHTYLDDNPSGTSSDAYAIQVVVLDDDLGTVTVNTAAVVANMAPTPTIQGLPNELNLGAPLTLTANAADPGVQDTFVFAWNVLRNGVSVAAGAGSTFTFTPQATGAHLIRLTATDDDLGVGVTEVEVEVGACRLSGDTNGDCRVDLLDLNNVRNHFGETGLGLVDLSFGAPVAGTLLDKDGLGTGLTDRLPGTGAGLAANDPNLDLEPGGGGRLRLRSTAGDLGSGGVNLSTLEAPGVALAGVGADDFQVSVTLLDIALPDNGDQLVLYVGASATEVFRGGFNAANGIFQLATNAGIDAPLDGTLEGAAAYAAGDDVILTIARRAAEWEFSWENLSNPAMSGRWNELAIPWLDDEQDLFVGVAHYDVGAANSVRQTATIDVFLADILRPVPGDTNDDFVVDLVDLNAVRNNFGASAGSPQGVATTLAHRQSSTTTAATASAADVLLTAWAQADCDVFNSMLARQTTLKGRVGRHIFAQSKHE